MKVYVVGSGLSYARWIDGVQIVNDINDANIVFFTGGCDVSPELYGCKRHYSTWDYPSRDAMEVAAFRKMRPDQLAFGTCRGLQFLCAINGGLLIQDVSNHAGGSHNITNGKDIYEVVSLHHQMIYPWNLDPKDYDILYWSDKKRSAYYEGDKIDPSLVKVEPEVAVFHKEGLPICLGVQGHPEMMRYGELHEMLNKLILYYGKL